MMLMFRLSAVVLRRLALLLAVVLLGMFVWGGNQPEAAGLIDPPLDKLAHLAWFAVLAGLLRFGLGRRWTLAVAVFCLGVGLWDEWRQLSLPGRAAGWDDLLFDCLGVALGVWLANVVSPILTRNDEG
jgi:VanZ family protein